MENLINNKTFSCTVCGVVGIDYLAPLINFGSIIDPSIDLFVTLLKKPIFSC